MHNLVSRKIQQHCNLQNFTTRISLLILRTISKAPEMAYAFHWLLVSEWGWGTEFKIFLKRCQKYSHWTDTEI